MNKAGFDKVLLEKSEFILETSFCSSFLYFETNLTTRNGDN